MYKRILVAVDGSKTSRGAFEAAIHLAADLVLADISGSRDRHVEIYVPVVGVQIDIGREIARDFQRDAAIADLLGSLGLLEINRFGGVQCHQLTNGF